MNVAKYTNFPPGKEIYVKKLNDRANVCPRYKAKAKFYIITLSTS